MIVGRLDFLPIFLWSNKSAIRLGVIVPTSAHTAGEEAWEDGSEGLEDALHDVQHALDKASKKIKMAL